MGGSIDKYNTEAARRGRDGGSKKEKKNKIYRKFHRVHFCDQSWHVLHVAAVDSTPSLNCIDHDERYVVLFVWPACV
jgi:hypothetical protein